MKEPIKEDRKGQLW